jgi:hypothetical protein
MQFNLRAALNALLRLADPGPRWEASDEPVSLVMLLRESRVFGLDRLRRAGESAFGVPFSDDSESKYFVIQKVLFTIMKVGPHALSFLHYTKPYSTQEFGASMPMESQRQAWAQHTAWEAIDYVKSGKNLDLEYAILARLCLQLADGNCVGVYLPRESIFVPNDGPMLPYLHRVASAYPVSINVN